MIVWSGVTLLALAGVIAAAITGLNGRAATSGTAWQLADFGTVRAGGLLGLAVLAAAGPLAITVSGVPRAVAGFVVLLLAPGAALVGFIALRDVLTELVLAFALSLVLLALLCELMLLAGVWQPRGLFVVLDMGSAPILAWHAGRAEPVSPSSLSNPLNPSDPSRSRHVLG
jgi:hypothetical protein